MRKLLFAVAAAAALCASSSLASASATDASRVFQMSYVDGPTEVLKRCDLAGVYACQEECKLGSPWELPACFEGCRIEYGCEP